MTDAKQKTRSQVVRGGFLLTEVLVAAVVLVVVVTVVTQVAVRSGRLRLDARHHQVALDELSNQLDRLAGLGEASRNRELQSLTPSSHAQAALASPMLLARVLEDADGRRLVLSLEWKRAGGGPPMTLVGWLGPAPSKPAEAGP